MGGSTHINPFHPVQVQVKFQNIFLNLFSNISTLRLNVLSPPRRQHRTDLFLAYIIEIMYFRLHMKTHLYVENSFLFKLETAFQNKGIIVPHCPSASWCSG